MAIYYTRTNFIKGKGSGNAVRPVAYNRAAIMEDAGTGKVFDHTDKHEVIATGLAIPPRAPAWLNNFVNSFSEDLASSAIWNFVDDQLPRKDGQLAASTMVSLPKELSNDENIALIHDIADEFARENFVADWGFHNELHTQSGEKNPHVHFQLTLRPLTESGFGAKRVPVLDAEGNQIQIKGKDRSRGKYTEWSGGLPGWRRRGKAIELLINKHLAMAGIDASVDCRSNAEKRNGKGLSVHKGPRASAMEARGQNDNAQSIKHKQSQRTDRERIREKPLRILADITEQKATFTLKDVERSLSRLGFKKEERRSLLTDRDLRKNLIMVASRIVRDGESLSARYSTPAMIQAELIMIKTAKRISSREGRIASLRAVDRELAKYRYFSEEQAEGVRYLTSAGNLKSLVGLAGTGKSTLLRPTNTILRDTGYETIGVALAGKAAEELQAASGIPSRTLALALMQLKNGQLKLSSRHAIVLDEAGMVGSRDMAALLEYVEKAGAKVILTGDPDQLPAISAGASFRAVLDHVDTRHTISKIRRQRNPEHSAASQHFARFNIAAGLKVYEAEGAIHAEGSLEAAITKLSAAYLEDRLAGRDVLAITYRNLDVRRLNTSIRQGLIASGLLKNGLKLTTTNRHGDIYKDDYAVGDKVLFLKNDSSLNVTNGTTGILTHVSRDRIVAKIGDRKVTFDPKVYDHFTHGYAVTIHKSQGASHDSVHVLASQLIDRNLTYVAMTRHKESVQLYFDEADFKEGIVKGLSRERDKTTTLDHPNLGAVIGFGERRGLQTRSDYQTQIDAAAAKASGQRSKVEIDQPLEHKVRPEVVSEITASTQPILAVRAKVSIRYNCDLSDAMPTQVHAQRAQIEQLSAVNSAEHDVVDWCIEPQTEFEETVDAVTERAVRNDQSFRAPLASMEDKLVEIFGEAETSIIIPKLATESLVGGEGYDDYSKELCARAAKLPSLNEQCSDEPSAKRRRAIERARSGLPDALVKLGRIGSRTYKRKHMALQSDRVLLERGLAYPTGQVGALLKQEQAASSEGGTAFKKLETLCTGDEKVLKIVDDFLDQRRKLRAAIGWNGEGAHTNGLQPNRNQLERMVYAQRLSMSANKKTKKSMSM
ncbi:MAG: Ti-type conjugative transfer relaxase TraA [Hyphomonadaceae bacterium]